MIDVFDSGPWKKATKCSKCDNSSQIEYHGKEYCTWYCAKKKG